MPGMNSGIDVSDPVVVAAFKAALVHQGLIALLIFALVGLSWVTVRTWTPAGAGAGTRGPVLAEPAWRRLLRIGFGLIWILDGILQAQPKMAVGLPSQVIEPIAASSPRWVQQVVNWAGTNWSYHPMQAGAVGGMDPGRDRHLAARPRRAARCPAWPGWSASAGAWWCGCSASRSAGSSLPA